MENIENINKLKVLASSFTILFVEDSKALQKQVMKFLEKLFKEVYVANNGQEGLESFQKYKPDLILTDLTMPVMTGHEMIRAIKKLDADVEVIILSAHSDSETLMKSLHIGVSDFIPKPANATKMILTFLKVLSNIKRKESQIVDIFSKEDVINKEDEEILDFIFENSMEVDIINHYKGVPIISSGKILEINDDKILLKISHLQLLAIEHENSAILDSSLIAEDINCSVESINVDKYQVNLKKEKLFYPELKNRDELKLEVEKEFKLFLLNKNNKLGTKIIYISEKELSFELNSDLSFHKHDKLELEVSFPPLEIINNEIKENIFTFFVTIYKYEKDNERQKLTVLFNEDIITRELIRKYIYNREIVLLDEFKNRYNY